MRSEEENIEALSRAMLSEAEQEAEKIMADARTQAEAIRKRGQEQAEAQADAVLERARQESERLRGQALATTQMKARTMELGHREKLLEKVFATSKEQVASVQQRSDYPEIARRLVREAVVQIRAKEIRVRADTHTLGLLTSAVLAEIAKESGVSLSLGEPLKEGTGVVVETLDGHLQFDNTLETRLVRLQNSLRAPVYRLLIGEKL